MLRHGGTLGRALHVGATAECEAQTGGHAAHAAVHVDHHAAWSEAVDAAAHVHPCAVANGDATFVHVAVVKLLEAVIACAHTAGVHRVDLHEAFVERAVGQAPVHAGTGAHAAVVCI